MSTKWERRETKWRKRRSADMVVDGRSVKTVLAKVDHTKRLKQQYKKRKKKPRRSNRGFFNLKGAICPIKLMTFDTNGEYDNGL